MTFAFVCLLNCPFASFACISIGACLILVENSVWLWITETWKQQLKQIAGFIFSHGMKDQMSEIRVGYSGSLMLGERWDSLCLPTSPSLAQSWHPWRPRIAALLPGRGWWQCCVPGRKKWKKEGQNVSTNVSSPQAPSSCPTHSHYFKKPFWTSQLKTSSFFLSGQN